MAQSALSQIVRRTEERLGLRLLTRTTRSVMRGGREVRVRMEGQLLLNTIDLILDAAIDGHGLAYLPYDQVQQAIQEKKTDPRSGEIYARLTWVSSVLSTPPPCGFGIFSVN